MPEVSVIVPTCNRQHLVEKAIRSVLSQTFEDFELIVVDDGSKDNTFEVVTGINDIRLKYIRHDQQKGAPAARNTGVSASSGNFLAFLDDDDEWLPDKLKYQMEVFKSKPDIGLVYTGYYYIDANSNKVFQEFRPQKNGMLDDFLLSENCIGTTSTVVVKRDCFNKVGGFDVDLRGSQDWDLWIRIAREYPIEYVAKPLVNFLNHDVRITHNINAKIQGKERILKKIFSDIKNKPNILSEHFFVIGYLYCISGDMQSGRRKLFEAIKLRPNKLRYYKHYIPALLGSSFYQLLSSKKNKYFFPARKNG